MKIPFLPIIFTLLILYVAVMQLDWHALLGAFQQTDVEYVLLALITWGALVLLKAFKWQCIVAALNGKISILESLNILFIALFVSIITPGRLGDFVRAIYLKDRLPLGKGILAVIVDRAMDVISLLIFSGIGLIMLTRASGVEFISPELVAVLILASFVSLIVLLNRRVAKKLFQWTQHFLPDKIKELLEKHGHTFYDAIPLFRTNIVQIFLAIVTSTLAWILSISFGWFLMLALNLPLEWSAALAVVPILALIEIIPIGILGIGAREIGAVIIMGAFGVSPEDAIAFSLLFFALGYIPSFVIGSVLFNRKPISLDGGLKGLAARMG